MDWLKMLGTTEHQMQDDWLNEGDREKTFVASRKRMSLRPGDGIALYATGVGSVFGFGTVTTFAYKKPDTNGEGFEWRVDVNLGNNYREFLHEGVPLELVSVDGRDLRKSIKQQSHIKLSPIEFDAVKKALAS
jgi:hypothetical protein